MAENKRKLRLEADRGPIKLWVRERQPFHLITIRGFSGDFHVTHAQRLLEVSGGLPPVYPADWRSGPAPTVY